MSIGIQLKQITIGKEELNKGISSLYLRNDWLEKEQNKLKQQHIEMKQNLHVLSEELSNVDYVSDIQSAKEKISALQSQITLLTKKLASQPISSDIVNDDVSEYDAMDEAVTEDAYQAMDEVVMEDAYQAMDEVVMEDTYQAMDEVVMEDAYQAMDEAVVEDAYQAMDEAVMEDAYQAMDEVVMGDAYQVMDEAVMEDAYDNFEKVSAEIESRMESKSPEPIKYEPNQKFEQFSEPTFYPFVKMPVTKALVKYPILGRSKKKGVSENWWHPELLSFFTTRIKRNFSLKFEGALHNYEPDFTFVDSEFNLFVDIEIDEPYSGTTRKPMHYVGSYDRDRNRYYNQNGWVVIRFAEEQIVKQPKQCCQYVAKVVNSLIGSYSYAEGKTELKPIKQWTYEEAKIMADVKYRESYLGLEFELVQEEVVIDEMEENKTSLPIDYVDENVLIKDTRDTIIYTEHEENIKCELEQLINEYAVIDFDGYRTMVRVDKIVQVGISWMMKGYDWIKNVNANFEILKIRHVQKLDNPFLSEGNNLTGEQFKNQIELANDNFLYVQIFYRNGNGEESKRTISNFQRNYSAQQDEWWYSSNLYVKAFCNLRQEERTFRFDRIGMMRVLNFSYD